MSEPRPSPRMLPSVHPTPGPPEPREAVVGP